MLGNPFVLDSNEEEEVTNLIPLMSPPSNRVDGTNEFRNLTWVRLAW